MNQDTRNAIIFAIFASIILLGYNLLIVQPQAKLRAEAERAKAAQTARSPGATASAPAATAPVAPNLSRPAALALAPRIPIDSKGLTGSISLRGGRVDDLFLKGFHEQADSRSPLVELLRPEGMAEAYFAQQGWAGSDLISAPNAQTLWTVVSGSSLSEGHPVVLSWTSLTGLQFTRTIAVDSGSMFTITDRITNTGAAPVTLAPYVSVQRQGLPQGLGKSGIVHEGAIGILGEDGPQLRLSSYKDWKKKGEVTWRSKGGWFGVTDKYWMTAFIPDQTRTIDAKARVTTDAATGIDIYETTYASAPRSIAPGATIEETDHLFAGAKKAPVLRDYGKTLGIPRFIDAVDWGNLWFLTKPIFTLLETFNRLTGNFGIAILMLTVVIRLITFPLAHRGFEMGVKMKKIQPELQALQTKFKDDPAGQQKEMMALYAREKVNPITGCLPVLFQIPVFYSLTKLFTVTIEMRHAVFFGWIHDLSAPDPTTWLNLFGLIPWDPSMTPLIGAVLGGVLHVGVWPLMYGLTMWLTQAMSPPTGVDPAQQMVFKFMPIMFTFILKEYAVGLLIYWTWSSLITILQQYLLMRRHKVANPIDDLLARFGGSARAAT